MAQSGAAWQRFRAPFGPRGSTPAWEEEEEEEEG